MMLLFWVPLAFAAWPFESCLAISNRSYDEQLEQDWSHQLHLLALVRVLPTSASRQVRQVCRPEEGNRGRHQALRGASKFLRLFKLFKNRTRIQHLSLSSSLIPWSWITMASTGSKNITPEATQAEAKTQSDMPPNSESNQASQLQLNVDPHLVYFKVNIINRRYNISKKSLTRVDLISCSATIQNVHSIIQCGRSG